MQSLNAAPAAVKASRRDKLLNLLCAISEAAPLDSRTIAKIARIRRLLDAAEQA